MRNLLRTSALTVCTLLAACNFAPFYHRPSVPDAQSFKETDQGWAKTTGNQVVSSDEWWKSFNDPTLNDLEGRVAKQNQNLKAALARYDEARAAVIVAGAALFPVVTGTADVTRSKNSGTTVQHLSRHPFNDWTAGLSVGYEVDVWGRVRNAVAAAGDQAVASADDAAALKLDLLAQAASGYFALRGEDAEVNILTQSVKNYQGELALTQKRHDGGIAMASDVDQAVQEVKAAQAQLDAMQLRRQQQEHALAVLAGENPATFNVGPAPFVYNIQPFNPGTPSTLLERRPDIAAAERRVAAANHEIGVARAAYFPEFDLSGTLGLESQTLGKLVEAPSTYWSVGPSLTQTIFDAGEITALTQEARAAYDEQVADYRQTALAAFQGIEDNLAGQRQLAQQVADATGAAAADDRIVQQYLYRYQGGITTSLDLAVEENIDLQAKLSVVDAQISQVTSYIQLIEDVGGGWTPTPMSTPLPKGKDLLKNPI